MKYFAFVLAGWLGLMVACNPTTEPPPNPFDGIPPDTTATIVPVNVNPKSIVGLHYNIFGPTCANSGCHDGTFEPDFRTIESTYNTLVHHPIIKNDPQGSFSVRVTPGNAAKSILWNRLNVDIDGQSGIMPLALEPDSDWPSKKDEYLGNIKAWIDEGAKDMFGNSPVAGNIQPSMKGVIAFANGGGTPLTRDAGTGHIAIPGGTNSLEIWVSLTDDVTAPQNLGFNKAKFATEINGFDGVSDQNMQVVSTPKNELDFFGAPADYYHKVTINPNDFAADARIFMRIYVKDPGLPNNTEIPGDGSADYIKEYFSFQK